jgi:CubicO group peptidase (beta-lactamase class C family)
VDDSIAALVPADGPGLALAVTASGAVVHAAGYGLSDLRSGSPVAPDTIFHLASCGKQFTGLGILMLAEERRLGLDDPLGKYIPALSGFGSLVTIRTLLHHTSGIRDMYDEIGTAELLARNERPTNADLIRTYAALGCPMARRRIRPGDEFSYSNSGYELLGSVIEQAARRPYRDFFEAGVFAPLGMRDTFSVPDRRVADRRCATGYVLDDTGAVGEDSGSEFDGLVGSGSFYTTVLDLCRYEEALRTHRLVSEASLDEAFTSGQTNDREDTGYGFGWYLGSQDGAEFADHQGEWNGHYAYICHYLDRPAGIFVLSNNPDVDPVEVANLAADAYAGETDS